MLGFLIDAHEKRPGVEHELIREARDRERWLIFFLVCAGYAVLQTAARFPDEFDALTSFPASERQYYKALAWARAARGSLLNSLAALLAALLLERIRRRVARRGASSARKYERRRRQQRPRLPPELWAHVLGDFLPAQQVALLACCGGDVGAASASEETARGAPAGRGRRRCVPAPDGPRGAHRRRQAGRAVVQGGPLAPRGVLGRARGARRQRRGRERARGPARRRLRPHQVRAGPPRVHGHAAGLRRRGARAGILAPSPRRRTPRVGSTARRRTKGPRGRRPRRHGRLGDVRGRRPLERGPAARRDAPRGRDARRRARVRGGGAAARARRARRVVVPRSAAPAGSSARGAGPSSRTTRARAARLRWRSLRARAARRSAAAEATMA